MVCITLKKCWLCRTCKVLCCCMCIYIISASNINYYVRYMHHTLYLVTSKETWLRLICLFGFDCFDNNGLYILLLCVVPFMRLIGWLKLWLLFAFRFLVCLLVFFCDISVWFVSVDDNDNDKVSLLSLDNDLFLFLFLLPLGLPLLFLPDLSIYCILIIFIR